MPLDQRMVQDMVVELGRQGHFQSRQIRERLGIPANDRGQVGRFHNLFKAVEAEGLIVEVPGNRKRNKFYALAEQPPARLGVDAKPPIETELPPQDATTFRKSTRAKSPSAPDRLTRIEKNLANLTRGLDEIRSKLDTLINILR